jgi:hypothetical protein
MSEPLAERLSRFTPDSAGLDRDALLFAAGRASVRPSRRWMALAGALAASQLITLACLWPTASPSPAITAAALPEPSPAPTAPIPLRDPSELGMLRDRILASEGDWSSPADEGPMIASPPPLRAFGTPDSTILN